MRIRQKLWVCGLRAFLWLATICGVIAINAAPLSAREQSVLREGSLLPEGQKRLEAVALVQTLGKANNYDALPVLMDVGDDNLFYNFSASLTGPTTPQLESLIIEYRHHPKLGNSIASLVRTYHSRELFNAFLADIKAQLPKQPPLYIRDYKNYPFAVSVITRTDLPGIERDLTEILPRVDFINARGIAALLVKQKYLPAEAALIDLFRRTPLGGNKQLGTAAETISHLGTQPILDAMVRRLLTLRRTPPNPYHDNEPELRAQILSGPQRTSALEQHARGEDLVELINAIGRAPPHLKCDRSILSEEAAKEFTAEYRVKIIEMMKARIAFERLDEETTPDNFCFWVRGQYPEEVRRFITRGANLNAACITHNPPLVEAVGYSNWEAALLLLNAGADPNMRSVNGLTPLQTLAHRQQVAGISDGQVLVMAKRLIEKGANVSATGPDGNTPLHMAAYQKARNMIELLLDNGASVNAEAYQMGIHGITPTLISTDQGDADSEALLRSKGGTINYGFVAKRAAQRAMGILISPLIAH